MYNSNAPPHPTNQQNIHFSPYPINNFDLFTGRSTCGFSLACLNYQHHYHVLWSHHEVNWGVTSALQNHCCQSDNQDGHEVTDGWVAYTAWIAKTKMTHVLNKLQQTAWSFITPWRTLSPWRLAWNAKFTNCLFLEIFMYYFPAVMDWLEVTETIEHELRDNGSSLYRFTHGPDARQSIIHVLCVYKRPILDQISGKIYGSCTSWPKILHLCHFSKEILESGL